MDAIDELRIRLPTSLAVAVRRVAAHEERSISAVVRRALRQMLELRDEIARAEREAAHEPRS